MDCTDLEKLAAIFEEGGEVAKSLHDQEGVLRQIDELLDLASASSAWAAYLFESLGTLQRQKVLHAVDGAKATVAASLATAGGVR